MSKDPSPAAIDEYLNTVPTRLSNDSFSIQRNVQVNQYALDIVASGKREATLRIGAVVSYADVVALCSSSIQDPDGIRLYSSTVARYVLDNRHALGVRRNSFATIAGIVAPNFPDSTKQWVSETSPKYSSWWDRAEFPVLIELDSRQITYFTGSPSWHYVSPNSLYRILRTNCDKWLGFQA